MPYHSAFRFFGSSPPEYERARENSLLNVATCLVVAMSGRNCFNHVRAGCWSLEPQEKQLHVVFLEPGEHVSLSLGVLAQEKVVGIGRCCGHACGSSGEFGGMVSAPATPS